MRTAFIPALAGLAAALPQAIDLGLALNAPTPTVLGPNPTASPAAPVSYTPAAAAASVVADVAANNVDSPAPGSSANKMKRGINDPCASQPAGSGPTPSPNTAAAFQADNTYSDTANAAQAPVAGDFVESFKGLTASVEMIGYLTYYTLDSYDTEACAAYCRKANNCFGFNIYYERDPLQNPDANSCPDPDATVNIKCSLYGYPVSASTATNNGQGRASFQVLIAGSNGYSIPTCENHPTIGGFNPPTSLKAAINAPLLNGYDTYTGQSFFNDNPYDPSLCAAACNAQTTYDIQHPASDNSYKACNFFTSYVLYKNGVPLGQYCALYTNGWSDKYAVNTGYWYGQDQYTVGCAASYFSKTPNCGGAAPNSAPNADCKTIQN